MAQAMFEFDPFPADRSAGFEVGWDFAHHALTPPVEQLHPGSPLRQGWQAGRACFGSRTLPATRHVRHWLLLRLNAWHCGRAFEGVQVTPNFLRQIDVAWCPITRQPLSHLSGDASESSINRVHNDGAYAAGNLVAMSARADAAKGGCGFDDALSLMRLAEAVLPCSAGQPAQVMPAGLAGLDAAEWGRIAVLCSFVTALPHAQAAALPLLVLPPNRLRLLNPVQALQALLTRQFGQDGWSRRIAAIEALIPRQALRRDFQRFVHALLPRVLERGRHADAWALRWTLEDAWRNPLVLRCWTRFARQLSAEQAEQMVLCANALRAADEPRAVACSLAEATEGWALASGGFVATAARNGKTTGQRHAPPAEPRAALLQLALCV